MIKAIDAIHAAIRSKKRPEDQINYRVEVKKRRRRSDHLEENECLRCARERRGRTE